MRLVRSPVYNTRILLSFMGAVLKQTSYCLYMNTWITIALLALCLVSFPCRSLYVAFQLSQVKIFSGEFYGSEDSRLTLDWPTRFRICLGIAKGLAFLHEESSQKIVHRDIKATNVLLDGQLNPKISDFGLAKLNEEEKTHISTRVAGTM